MDRRHFLQNLAVAAAAAKALEAATEAAQRAGGRPPRQALSSVNVHGHTQVATFTHAGESWTVYEDLRTRVEQLGRFL